MNSILNLEGKIAPITGGSGVLGNKMGEVLAKQGVTTGIVGLSLKEAQVAVDRIESNG